MEVRPPSSIAEHELDGRGDAKVGVERYGRQQHVGFDVGGDKGKVDGRDAVHCRVGAGCDREQDRFAVHEPSA